MAVPWLQRLVMGGGPYVGLGGTGGINGGAYPPPWSTPPIMPTSGGGMPGPFPQIAQGGVSAVTPPPPPPKGPKWLQALYGGLNKGVNALAGPANPNLSQQEQEAQRAHQMRMMAGTLLAGAGPRPQGTRGVLQPFGEAMIAGQSAGMDFSNEAMGAKLMQAQMAQAQRATQERADPAAIREMQTLGYPMTQEGFAAYNRDRGSDGTNKLAEIQAQLAIEQRRDQIARDRAADEKTATEAARERATLGNTIRRSLVQTGDIAALTEKLEGSFLSAGMPASSWRRTGASLLAGAGAALGMPQDKLEADLVNFDKLKKGLSDQLNNLVASGSLGQVTNDKLQSFRDALANTETSPGAIMSIQAGIAEAMLEEADAQGVEVGDRAKIEANIQKWRKYESQDVEPVADVPGAMSDFSKMTDEQLRRIISGK